MARSPAVVRAVAVLELLARTPVPRAVTDIAHETGLPVTTLRGICQTLTEERVLARGDNGHYWIGPRIAEFAAAAQLASTLALRIGLLIPTRRNDFYTSMMQAATAAVHASGGELFTLQADEDTTRQREQWQELLRIGVDVVLIDSVDSGALGDMVEQTRALGIPIVAVGSRVSRVDVSVVSDNTQAGLLSGRHLASQLTPGSRVAIIDGLRKNANAERIAGFVEAIAETPGIEIVAHAAGRMDNVASGRATMAKVLRAHDTIDGVFAVCDPVAFGASEAVRAAGRSVKIVSVDGRARALEQVAADGPIIATAAQDPPRIIRTALEVARGLVAGARPDQGTTHIPVRLITKTNAETYTPWL